MTSEVRERFLKFWPRKALISIVPYVQYEQTLKDVLAARREGADGVILTLPNHGVHATELLLSVRLMRSDNVLRGFFIGVRLSMDAFQLFGASDKDTGLSCRSAGTGRPWNAEYSMNWFHNRRDKIAWDSVYFGGVDYFSLVNRRILKLCAAQAAEECVDVITTSGPSEVIPPSLEKIQAMRGAIGDHPLAIESAINVGNVGMFLPYVDAFLVRYDQSTMAGLADVVHDFQPTVCGLTQ